MCQSVNLVQKIAGLGRFLANESPLKMMKNAFYFTFQDI